MSIRQIIKIGGKSLGVTIPKNEIKKKKFEKGQLINCTFANTEESNNE